MRCDLGVMISASHNLYEDNGIKLFGPDGYKLSDEIERRIEALMDEDLTRQLAMSGARWLVTTAALFSSGGWREAAQVAGVVRATGGRRAAERGAGALAGGRCCGGRRLGCLGRRRCPRLLPRLALVVSHVGGGGHFRPRNGRRTPVRPSLEAMSTPTAATSARQAREGST